MPAPIRSAQRVTVVLNPRAGAGRALLHVDALKRALDRHASAWELLLTEGPGHAAVLAAEAAARGVDVVAAAGGDGTAFPAAGTDEPGGTP